MNRRVQVGGAALATGVLMASAVLALSQPWQSGTSSAQEAFNGDEWRSTLQDSFSDLGPGAQYRLVVTEYNRHGAGADIIRENAEPYTPESTVRTTVHEFDGAGAASAFASTLVDAETGETLHEVELSDSAIVIRDHRDNVPADARTSQDSPPDYITSVDTARQQLIQTHAVLIERIVSQNEAEVSKNDEVIVVKESALLPTVTGGDDAFTVPYVRDLSAVSAFRLSTFDSSTFRLLSEETYAEDDSGASILISSSHFELVIGE